MDFALTGEQASLQAAVLAFARRELEDDVVARDHAGAFSRAQWDNCAAFGIHGLSTPQSYGGSGLDLLSTVIALEALGMAARDNGLLFSINAQMWSVQAPILEFGTDEQKQRCLPGLVRGELIGAHGMSEPDSGSDAYALRTTARRCDGGYVLNGTKTMVTNAPVADLAVVFATLDAGLRQWGISAFVVRRGAAGFGVSREFAKMGLRTSPMGELIFEDCFVPEADRLGPEGAGVAVFNHSMALERAGILATQVGAMQRQLDQCVRYAGERRQFGQPIGRFQSVSHRIADMKIRLETARLTLYKTAWLAQRGEAATMQGAIAKTYLSECFVQSSLDAIRVHGGYGYMTEAGLERELRDGIGGTLYSGTSDIQRNIVARLLGLG